MGKKTETKQNRSSFAPAMTVVFAMLIALTGCENSDSSSSQPASQAVEATPESTRVNTSPGMPGTADSGLGGPEKIGEKLPIYSPPIKKRDPVLMVDCYFSKEDFGKKDPHKTKCFVTGKVCYDHYGSKDYGYKDRMDKDKDFCECRNSLVVACNGEKVYAGEPTHTVMDGFDYLIGSRDFADSVILKFPHEKPGDACEDSLAKLNFKDQQLEGKCQLTWSEE